MTLRSLLVGSRATMLAVGLLLLSALLIVSHARTIGGLQANAIPLSADIPMLEQRLEVLSEQITLTEMQQALRVSTPEERMRVYVLPRALNLDRLIASFETLEHALRATRQLRTMSRIEFAQSGSAPSPVEGLESHSLRLRLSVTKEGLDAVLKFLDLAGSLTIADALSDEARQRLLQASEEENPSSIVALEQFLRTDLLAYATNSKSYDERLKNAFSSERFLAVLDGTLASSDLPAFTSVLASDIGSSIASRNLWPLPFLTVNSLRVTQLDSEWRDVDIELLTFTRK